MTCYITFNDQPSGIYQSQVVDVVSHLNKIGGKEITLIAFFPRQSYFLNRKLLKNQPIKSVVFPMIFGITRWRWHRWILKLFSSPFKHAICRGPLATELAFGIFDKVVYDGRAAVKAEVQEYDVTSGNKVLSKDLIEAEEKAVLNSDFRISVSNHLVDYWKKEFGYSSTNHVVIPSTLTSEVMNNSLTDSGGVGMNVGVVYSGSTSGWQSFPLVVEKLEKLLEKQSNVEVLFLTNESSAIKALIDKFPDRCKRKFVEHEQVLQVLAMYDYGILIRDDKITNQVASPVKFAEYLSAGLQVLISPHLGDFTEFVKEHQCGHIVDSEILPLSKQTLEQRQHSVALSRKYFLKSSEGNAANYLRLISWLK